MRSARIVSFTVILSLFGATLGCETDDSTTNNVDLLDLHGTIQGVIVDAMTGKPVPAGLQVRLLIDGQEIEPSTLVTSPDNPSGAIYAFTDVPTEVDLPILAWHENYQAFEGTVRLEAAYEGGDYFLKRPVLNANIQMFPVAYATPDYAIVAAFNGKPVPNASVILSPDFRNSKGLAKGDYLPATSNRLQALTATTDDRGTATFLASDLVLGGVYVPTILPLQFTDLTLGEKTGQAVTIGLSPAVQVITLNPLSPWGEEQLYVESSNNDDGSVKGAYTGLLIRFSRPIEIINPAAIQVTTFGGDSNNNDAVGVIVTDKPDTAKNESVDVELDDSGTMMTLFPKFSPDNPPDPGDFGFGISVRARSFLRVRNGNGTVYSLGMSPNSVPHFLLGEGTDYLSIQFF